MSLIQEALRRKTEGSLPLSAAAQRTPPPLPASPAAKAPPPAAPDRKPARIGLMVLLGVLLIGGAGTVLFWWLWPSATASRPPAPVALRSAQPTSPKPIAATAKPPAPIPSGTTTTAVASAVNPATPPAPTNAAPVPRLTAVTPPMSPPQATTNSALKTAGADATANLPAQAVASTGATVLPPTAPIAAPSAAARVRWPRLTVTGVMARRDREGVAFINQKQAAVGDRVDGAQVLQIKEDGVQLVFQGETNTLRIGQSTF